MILSVENEFGFASAACRGFAVLDGLDMLRATIVCFDRRNRAIILSMNIYTQQIA